MSRKMSTAKPAPDRAIEELVALAGRDERAGLARLETLLETHGQDARLHFLKGSLLAATQAYDRAHEAFKAAVDLEPGFAVARFQLGLLELSGGDAAAAVETLRPLETLPPQHPLRLFARGLNHMIVDDFGPAIALLEEGITRNSINPAMNRDMELLIEGMREKLGAPPAAAEPVSSAHFLLQQYAQRPQKPDA